MVQSCHHRWRVIVMNTKKQIISYCAGLIDADGCIGIKRSTYSMRVTGDATQPTYSERIHIRQVEKAGLTLLAETFGGNIRTEDPSAKRGKPLYTWGQTDAKAAQTLLALLPFLRIKRKQAENCLGLRKVKESSKKTRIAKGRGHVGAAIRPKHLSDAMQAHYTKAKQLNSVGV